MPSAPAASSLILLLAVRLPAALAAPITTDDSHLGQTPPSLSWIDLKDSRGISMWNFELSLDRGGLTSADKVAWSMVTDWAWGAYRGWCALALWFLDWVMSFSWVDTIASPILTVGDSMQSVVNKIGLVPTFLTVTALLAGLWFLKGRYTTAIWEVGIACVIAALASGVFAHPVHLIAGSDGYIVKANQAGQELAAQLATGSSAGKTPEQLRQAQTGKLVDTFIRQPTELINFGRVLDGGKCESAYNEVVKKGPYGTKSDIRDAVNGCDKSLGDYAANPSSGMAMGSLLFIPAAFVILAMGLMFAGSVIAAALWAMFQALKAIVTLITGLLPGGGRGSLMLTVAETIVSLLLIVFTSVFLSVFLLIVQTMFAGTAGDSVAKTFVIVDVVMVAALVIYGRQRKQIKSMSERMGRWMSQRPGGAPATQLPDRQPGLSMAPAAAAVRTVAGLAAARRLSHASGPSFVDNRQQAVFLGWGQRPQQPPEDLPYVHLKPVPRAVESSGRPVRALPAGPDTPPSISGSPQGPSPSQGGGGGGLSRAANRKKAGAALLRAGTGAALAYATGGASSVITAGTAARRVARTAQTARRVALTARFAAAAKNATTRAATTKTSPSTNPFATGATNQPGTGQVIVGKVLNATTQATPSTRPTPGRSGAAPTPGAGPTSGAGPTPGAGATPGRASAAPKPGRTSSAPTPGRSTAAPTPGPSSAGPTPSRSTTGPTPGRSTAAPTPSTRRSSTQPPKPAAAAATTPAADGATPSRKASTSTSGARSSNLDRPRASPHPHLWSRWAARQTRGSASRVNNRACSGELGRPAASPAGGPPRHPPLGLGKGDELDASTRWSSRPGGPRGCFSVVPAGPALELHRTAGEQRSHVDELTRDLRDHGRRARADPTHTGSRRHASYLCVRSRHIGHGGHVGRVLGSGRDAAGYP